MNFRTSKCTHGNNGMCINCMVNKNKSSKNMQGQKQAIALSCKHPSNMKCLRCLPYSTTQNKCKHPDYQKCKQCENYLKYDKFSYYLQNLAGNCSHKKPCHKCVPPLDRKTFQIDIDCKKHLPYPQALCDACMAPTLTISAQGYSHVSRVIVRTKSINKVSETSMLGILLGHYQDDIVYIDQIYFPQEQQKGVTYMDPAFMIDRKYLFEYLNLEQVGLIYSSKQITGLSLMLSSLFQQKYKKINEDKHNLSKFVTMRLQYSENDFHLECFMVSDQFQAFHKNSLVYEIEKQDNYFDLITAKCQNKSIKPTFLREGIQTDRIYFKQILIWIPIFAEDLKYQQKMPYYSFYSIQVQNLNQLASYIQKSKEIPQNYMNIQFLLHLQKLLGQQGVFIFLNDFYLLSPYVYLKEKLRLLKKIQEQTYKQEQNPMQYQNQLFYRYDV